MTDTLGIIRLLGTLSEDQIARALTRSHVGLNRVHDPYDAAEVLDSDDAVDGRLRFVSRTDVVALQHLAAGALPDSIPADARARLRAAVLVTDQDVPLQRAAERAAGVELLPDERADDTARTTPWDSAAGVAHRTLRLLDGLIAALHETPAKALQRGGIAQPDRVRLAAYLGIDSATTVIRLALVSGVIGVDSERVCAPTRYSEQWLASPPVARWRAIAQPWFDQIIPEIGTATIDAWRAHIGEYTPLLNAVVSQLPFARQLATDTVGDLRAAARSLGIADDSGLTELGAAWLAGDPTFDATFEKFAFPLIDYVYPQADLTVIAPGILTHDLESKLCEVATCITFGDASVFRVTPPSLQAALLNGWTADSILEFFESIARGGVPQPLRYVINDTAQRLENIRVHADGNASVIVTATPEMADAISRDRDLAMLGLRRHDRTHVESKLPIDVTLNALLDAHYGAIRDDDESVPSGRLGFIVPESRANPAHTRALATARTIASMVADTQHQSDSSRVASVVEMAVRHRTPITVTVLMPNGTETQFELEPAGLAGGRLRGKDRRAEIERTLPISHITRVEPVETS